MQKIVFNQITGCISTCNFFEIYDEFGGLFYSNKEFVNKKRVFNVPRGTFFSDQWSEIKKLPRPVVHFIPKMPPKQRNYKFEKYNIIYSNNINKCTITYDAKTIDFDYSFKKMPFHFSLFILLHEYAHLYYKDENLADLQSAVWMLELGYNPEQVALSQIDILTRKQSDFRKNYVYNKLKLK